MPQETNSGLDIGWRKDAAKKAVAAGAIVGFVVESAEGGYLLRLMMNPALPATGSVYLIDFRRGTPRLFNSIDTAMSNAGDLGFDISELTSVALAAKFSKLQKK